MSSPDGPNETSNSPTPEPRQPWATPYGQPGQPSQQHSPPAQPAPHPQQHFQNYQQQGHQQQGQQQGHQQQASPSHSGSSAFSTGTHLGNAPYGSGQWTTPGPGAWPQSPPQQFPWADNPRPKSRSGGALALMVVGVLLLAFLAGITGGFMGGRLADGDDTIGLAVDPGRSGQQVDRPPNSVAAVASRVLPSVVAISVQGTRGAGTGSGFVIRSDGYLLTNNHVIEGAANVGRIQVKFNDINEVFDARVTGSSRRYDLAVLKIDKRNLPEMELGTSEAAVVGDPVIAIGAPLGLAGTVTTGIVSAKARPVTAGGSGSEAYIKAIQTDAAINPGNSGGPLVDSAGRVIGVNSAIASLRDAAGGQGGNIGLGFAIPIEQAKRTAEQIIRTGRPSYPIMGVNLDSSYVGIGARIATSPAAAGGPPISPDGPADKAGLRAGDVITRVGDTIVGSADELIVEVSSRQPGEEVEITYRRGGRESTTSVRLDEATE